MATVSMYAVLVLALNTLLSSAAPLTATPPYWKVASCFGVSSPDELVRHSLVVMAPTLGAGDMLLATPAPQHTVAENMMNFFFTELSRDFALKYCPRVALQPSDEFLLPEDQRRDGMLPLEHYDCDILVGDLPLGVSKVYSASKQPLHALVMADPVDSTVEDFFVAISDPKHPKHAQLAQSSLHAAILQAAALPASEQHKSGLLLNPITWRLCGFDCKPENMSLADALSRATANLNAHVQLVLSEHSQLWTDLAQFAASRDKSFSPAKGRHIRTAAAADLSAAEISILQNANYADRVLYGMVQSRETEERRCLRNSKTTKSRLFA